MLRGDVEDWTLQAKCRGMKDVLFPESADQKRARVVCYSCSVRPHCLAEALDNRVEWGVWGGMTERERRQLLRDRADITSWTSVLCPNPADPGPAAGWQRDRNEVSVELSHDDTRELGEVAARARNSRRVG